MSELTLRPSTEVFALPEIDMTTRLGSVVFPNPVFTASGCAASGRELDQFFDVSELGGVVTKSIMLAARSGRATPRMAETPSGMLNSIGLQGPGIDAFLDKDLPWLASRGARAVVSIAGGSVDDYAKLTAKLRGKAGLAMIEVNISCPNVEDRGQVFACDPRTAAAVIQAVKRSAPSGIPVFAKLSPDVTDITEIARACVTAGADGLSLINTLLGMVIDPTTMRPALAGVTGGLSAASGRSGRRCRRSPSSAWVASAPASTPSSWCWQVPTPSASARPPSATPVPPSACSTSSRGHWSNAASTASRTPLASPTGLPSRTCPPGPTRSATSCPSTTTRTWLDRQGAISHRRRAGRT